VPDLLEGIERAIEELGRTTGAPPALVGDLFQSAAAAIAQAARQVAERGRPDPEGAEFRRFAGLLMQFMATEPEIVPVDTLFYGDGGPDVVQRGTPAARPPTLGRLELVSHGEHLRQAADSLERAPSPTQRELRAHTLAGTFRALGGAGAGGGTVDDRLAEFAQAAREAVSSGVAVQQPAAFAAELRRAGDVLTRSASEDEAALAADLAAVTAAVRALGGAAASPFAPVVPIETLAPAPPAPPAPPARPAPAPRTSRPARAVDEPVTESGDLAGSWAAYQRLVTAGVGPPSLEELLRAPAAPPAPPAPPGLHAPQAAPRGEVAVVDIRQLLYRGQRARLRAQELRDAAARASGDGLRAIIDEVCDLVVLALEPEP
jgi:hypothetical protein